MRVPIPGTSNWHLTTRPRRAGAVGKRPSLACSCKRISVTAQTIDLVTLETSNDSAPPQLRLEGEDTGGKWSDLSDSPQEAIHPIRVNMRQAATAELKALGIRYVLIRKDDIRADDFIRFAPIWGLKLAGAIGDARLCSIE